MYFRPHVVVAPPTKFQPRIPRIHSHVFIDFQIVYFLLL